MVAKISFEDQITKNKIKSIVLMFSVVVFLIIIGYIVALIFDPSYFFIIMIISIVFSLTYTLVSYYNSDKIALASVRAKPASRTEHRMLFNAAESMSIASGLPMPKLYVMESEQINAFASGRDPQHAVMCVTTGALKKLNKQELEGVVGHEMSHIANYDMRFMTTVAVMVGLISIVAQIFLRSLWFSSDRDRKGGIWIMVVAVIAAILAPIVAQLVSLSISRKREFGADATAVKFTRYPKGLRGALKKIKAEHTGEQDKKKYP